MVYALGGLFTGVFRRLIGFVAVPIAFVAATNMGLQAGGILQQSSNFETPDARIYGFFGIATAVLVIIEGATQLANSQIQVPALVLNRTLGVIVGAFTGILLAVIVVYELGAAGNPIRRLSARRDAAADPRRVQRIPCGCSARQQGEQADHTNPPTRAAHRPADLLRSQPSQPLTSGLERQVLRAPARAGGADPHRRTSASSAGSGRQAQGQARARPDGARPARRPPGRARRAARIPGRRPHGGADHRRLHRDDRRSQRSLGNAADADARAGGREMRRPTSTRSTWCSIASGRRCGTTPNGSPR